MSDDSLLGKLIASRSQSAGAGIFDPDGTFTSLASLVTRAESIARGLRREGLREGDKVLFAVRPGAIAIASMLGVIEAGGTLVVSDLGVGERLFAQRMELLRPRWIIAESVLLAASKSKAVRRILRRRGHGLLPLEKIPDAKVVRAGRWLPRLIAPLSLDDIEAAGETGGGGAADAARDPESPVLIVFTSGTTAEPKAVVHTNRSMAATLDIISSTIEMIAGDVMHAREIHLILPALMAGATVAIPPFGKFSAAGMLADLERRKVTHFFAVTSECRTLLEHARAVKAMLPPTVRHAFIGAAPVHSAFLSQFREILPASATAWSLYGMTEMLPVAAISIDEKLAYLGDGDIVGAPLPGVTARISADGELVLKGPNLSTGYFGATPVDEHFTGDLAALDDGRIVLLGRSKDMMIRGRHNIYPELHEPVIETIEGVRRCAMVGLFDAERQDEVIVLALELHPGVPSMGMEERIRRELRSGAARIDDEAQPDEILIMDLPEGGRSRKVDKEAVREIARRKLQCG